LLGSITLFNPAPLNFLRANSVLGHRTHGEENAMTKKITLREPGRHMISMFCDMEPTFEDDMHDLVCQVFTTEDGKLLALTHFSMNPEYLLLGVLANTVIVEVMVHHNPAIQSISEVWNYLEDGLKLLGLTELSQKVRSHINDVSASLQDEDNFEYFQSKLDECIARHTHICSFSSTTPE
jgi:hypothetical protein